MIILGVGVDGHTASVFPEQPFLFTTENLVGFSAGPAGDRRMTLTPKLILKSRQIVVFVTGSHKKDIIRTLNGESILPICQITSRHKEVSWYIDSESLD